MKKQLFNSLFAIALLSSLHGTAQQPNSMAQSIQAAAGLELDVNDAANRQLSGLSNLELFDIDGDTLFIVNKNNLVQVNLRTGVTSTHVKVSAFLAKQLRKNHWASQLVRSGNGFYIAFFNELYEVSGGGDARMIYDNKSLIADLHLTTSGILTASLDSVKVISPKGKLLSSAAFSFTNTGFARTSRGICYNSVYQDDVYVFTEKPGIELKPAIYPSLSLNKEMAEPFMAYASEDYLFAFDYWKRKAIYVLRKESKVNKLTKTVSLKPLQYAPTMAEMEKEEGIPNFKVGFSNGTYYVIALHKNKLKIFPFKL
ncbi:hypothetical protein [Paraflavitalea sp. CAU 1676]|uniref:hypothetical protein n=1 Tax=Paraflavitalea sp. CAU 1676 TaxID=3032598 RepID=UPI0023DC1138|nr:hypothetical protein [Paraflavitalea sp. CAU 1676]MDF2188262.1 hypothetical protein [Paraflavitalea sp. CAU 1676]